MAFDEKIIFLFVVKKYLNKKRTKEENKNETQKTQQTQIEYSDILAHKICFYLFFVEIKGNH